MTSLRTSALTGNHEHFINNTLVFVLLFGESLHCRDWAVELGYTGPALAQRLAVLSCNSSSRQITFNKLTTKLTL